MLVCKIKRTVYVQARHRPYFILATADVVRREIYADLATNPAVKFFAELFYKKATKT